MLAAGLLLLLPATATAQNGPAPTLAPTAATPAADSPCDPWTPAELRRDPTEAELRCRWGITGPGRFGLLSYVDMPVYQPATPMPGTHVVGVPGHAGPHPGESFEEWERRVLRTEYGVEAKMIHRSLALLDPIVAGRVMRFERELENAGIRAVRRETWRSPERQAYLFQQGRSRPGPIATATLTSWHSQVDAQGTPAGRAVDYDVPRSQLRLFHEIAAGLGLAGFGADSNDPGHVFVPELSGVPDLEIVLLRLLPRVPEVTLATGLPVDRAPPAGGSAVLRAAVAEFIQGPFLPQRLPPLAAPPPDATIVTGLSAREPGSS